MESPKTLILATFCDIKVLLQKNEKENIWKFGRQVTIT